MKMLAKAGAYFFCPERVRERERDRQIDSERERREREAMGETEVK